MKELVSIKRETIDKNKIQGFVLDESKKLILIQYVYDFNLDGLMVLRKDDISSIETTDTDKFQTSLLKEEKILDKISFEHNYELKSWKSFFKSAMKSHQYFIIEEEEYEEPEFNIGQVLELKDDEIALKYFTGIARWIEEPVIIKYSDITCIQVETNYLSFYQRYFNKTTPETKFS